ncbi:MAG: hypothetical protein FD147_729 [Chloroflexi bacterium]|nr:MAG: hypothetical protein FD147_729 [Chloroflexota bacterium]
MGASVRSIYLLILIIYKYTPFGCVLDQITAKKLPAE